MHLVQMNHFDKGFTASLGRVLNQYFHDFLPQAMNTSEAFRADPKYQNRGMNYVYTMDGPWVAVLFLFCKELRLPEITRVDVEDVRPRKERKKFTEQVRCPSDELRKRLRKALERGDIAIPAFPFNAQVEWAPKFAVEFGLELIRRQLGGRLKKGGKGPLAFNQRDVPGTTAALLPILQKYGIKFVSVGMNPFATQPNVPWRSEKKIAAVFEWSGGGRVLDGRGRHDRTDPLLQTVSFTLRPPHNFFVVYCMCIASA